MIWMESKKKGKIKRFSHGFCLIEWKLSELVWTKPNWAEPNWCELNSTQIAAPSFVRWLSLTINTQTWRDRSNTCHWPLATHACFNKSRRLQSVSKSLLHTLKKNCLILCTSQWEDVQFFSKYKEVIAIHPLIDDQPRMVKVTASTFAKLFRTTHFKWTIQAIGVSF